MNKIINSPENMVQDMLEGYLAAYSDMYMKIPGTNALMMKKQKEKVSVIVGGGAGNEPWVIGYVGKGLADGAALGNVYTAPPARSILNLCKAVYNKKGVIFVSTNHAGDVLNFELVGELAELEGIKTRCTFISDDISGPEGESKSDRRGVAGIALAVKMAGAAADLGLDLDEVVRIVEKTNDNLRTLSVTTSPGYMPGSGKAMFEMEEGTIEYGMGFNGEPGILKTPIRPAADIVKNIMDRLLADIGDLEGKPLGVLLNGFGFTSILELCIVNKEIKRYLDEKGVRIHNMDIKNAFCPQGTGGFSVSILKLDDELIPYFDYDAYSPFFNHKML